MPDAQWGQLSPTTEKSHSTCDVFGLSPQNRDSARAQQLSQTLLRGTSFWLTAIKQSASGQAWGRQSGLMAGCAFCKSETEFYDGGVPICVRCSDARGSKRKPPTSEHQLLNVLREDLQSAKERYSLRVVRSGLGVPRHGEVNCPARAPHAYVRYSHRAPPRMPPKWTPAVQSGICLRGVRSVPEESTCHDSARYFG